MKLRTLAIRSTPLRLTAMFLGIFILTSAASFVTAYIVIRANFDEALMEEVEQSLAAYHAIDDQDDLIRRLNEDVMVTDSELTILHYQPDSGTVIANVDALPPVSGFSIIDETQIDGGQHVVEDSYLAKSVRIGRGQLIVAKTRGPIVEMGETILTVVLIGLLPTIMLIIIAGVFAARNVRRRIDTIQNTLIDLTGGHLTARVPVDSNDHDDLAAIGTGVNTMATSQEALITSMRQVSTDIAHDLKTPIQRVAVILDEITRKTALSEGQGELLDQALTETDRIVKTFQALLQLAQIEGGAVRDRFSPTNLQEVTADVVDLLGAAAEEKDKLLELSVKGEGLFVVNGDRHLLTQILANLIENGLRHTPSGSEIRVNLSRSENRIVLCVADNGPGIPLNQREKVLRRLYRLEQSRTTKGNGLGLSLVAAICNLHGANLSLEDNDPGLRARMVFPEVEKT